MKKLQSRIKRLAILMWVPLLVLLCSADISPLHQDVIVGIWTNDDDHAIIELKKEGNFYVGILLRPAKGYELDKNGKPRGKERVITGLTHKDGEYIDARIFIAIFERYMDCDIVPVNANKLTFNIRYGIIKRSTELRRLTNYKP